MKAGEREIVLYLGGVGIERNGLLPRIERLRILLRLAKKHADGDDLIHVIGMEQRFAQSPSLIRLSLNQRAATAANGDRTFEIVIL